MALEQTPDASNREVTLELLGLTNISFSDNSLYIEDTTTDDHYTLNYDGRTRNGEPTSRSRNIAVRKTGTLTMTQNAYYRLGDQVFKPNPIDNLRNLDYSLPNIHELYQIVNIIVYNDIVSGPAAKKITIYESVTFQNDNTKVSKENGSQPLSFNFAYIRKYVIG